MVAIFFAPYEIKRNQKTDQIRVLTSIFLSVFRPFSVCAVECRCSISDSEKLVSINVAVVVVTTAPPPTANKKKNKKSNEHILSVHKQGGGCSAVYVCLGVGLLKK